MKKIFKLIDAAWENRNLLKDEETRKAVFKTVDLIDKGKLRIAEPVNGIWEVNDTAKKAVILYFPLQEMKQMRAGDLEFYDKIPLKKGYDKLGIRVVPQAVARYGAYISPGVIMMPSYINIGAYVDVKFGARPLKRAIQKYLEDGMAEVIIEASISEGDTVKVDLNEDKSDIKIDILKKDAPSIEPKTDN